MNRDREAIAVRASELFSDEFCSAFDWPDEQSDAFFEKVGLMVGSAVERAFDELALPVGGGVEEALNVIRGGLDSADLHGGYAECVKEEDIRTVLAALSPRTGSEQ